MDLEFWDCFEREKRLKAKSPLRVFAESELFTGDTSKDNHSPGPVFGEVSPQPSQEK